MRIPNTKVARKVNHFVPRGMSTAVKQRAKVTQLIIYFLKLVIESLKRHLNSHWEIGKFYKLYLNIHNFIHIALCPQLYAAFNMQNRNLYFSPYTHIE